MKWSLFTRPNLSRRSLYGMIAVGLLMSLLALTLIGKLVNLQLIQGRDYKRQAGASHFSKRPSYPERGKISDANGETLALTTYVYNIGITPAAVASQPPQDQADQKLDRQQIAEGFSTLLNLPFDQVQAAMEKKDKAYVVLKKEIPKEAYTPFEEFLTQHAIRGVAIDSLPKRFYPKDKLASQIVGFASRREDSGLTGVTGLEAYYQRELAGQLGYTYGEVDHYFGGQLPYSNPREQAPVPGHNLVLNLDSALQAEVERIVERYNDLFQATDGSSAIILDAKTGAVVAMAQEGGYNLNHPYEAPKKLEKGARAYFEKMHEMRGEDPLQELKTRQAELEKDREKILEETQKLEPGQLIQGPPTPNRLLELSQAEDAIRFYNVSVSPAGHVRAPDYIYKGWDPYEDKDDLDYLNRRLWTNRNVSFTYEPGSTMKSFTVATAYEEHAFRLDETFSDAPVWIRGFGDYALHCHVFPKNHGYETVQQALAQSCNPVMIQIAERVGIEKFYEYVHALGFYGLTGVDLPAESYGLLHTNPGVVDLAPMSFGESNTITPIALAQAYTVFANDGVMLKPQVVKYLTDKEGNVVREFPAQPVRQVYSRETVETVRAMLRDAVVNGIVRLANEPGYFVGAKTGTSTKSTKNTEEQDYSVMSVASLFPIDDPRYIVLGIQYNPNTTFTSGVQSMVRDLIRATGRLMHVPRRYTQVDLSQAIRPRKFSYANGITLQSIADTIVSLDIDYDLAPDMEPTDFFYSMYPAGTQELNGYPIYYVSKDGEPPKETVDVPDFTGKTFEEAAELAYQKRINLKYEGNPIQGVVVKQSIEAKDKDGKLQKMQKYGIVELTFGALAGYNPPALHIVENPVAKENTHLPVKTDPIWTTQRIYDPYGAIPEHNPYGG